MQRFGISRRAASAVAALIALAVVATACSNSPSVAPTTGTTTPATSSPTGSTTLPTTPSQTPASPPQSPVPAESNPPGDIPDNTVFVPYSSAGGFTITVPEGWARSNASTNVTFTFALNSIGAAWLPATAAPTVASANATDVPALKASELAFVLQSVKAVTLPGGSAVLITFLENSQPNAVTGKQYRLVVERFEFFKNGTEAALSLSSPVGADNVDPWRTVSESFAWA